MISTNKPLAGKRILIPPARPEVNPLLLMLRKKGAEVVEFPRLRVAPPTDYGPMDRAIQQLESFDWIILSGSNCVINFLDRLKTLGPGKEAIEGAKIAAIGHGAYSALKREGLGVAYVPKEHTADGVTEGFGKIRGVNFLLVRAEGASRALPEQLRGLGGKVGEVTGYRMLVEATRERAEKVFGGNLDILALANPTTARFLVKAAVDLGIDLQDCLTGVTTAAVGPATAEEARRLGLTPDIISKGHIADLVESLTDLVGKEK